MEMSFAQRKFSMFTQLNYKMKRGEIEMTRRDGPWCIEY